MASWILHGRWPQGAGVGKGRGDQEQASNKRLARSGFPDVQIPGALTGGVKGKPLWGVGMNLAQSRPRDS